VSCVSWVLSVETEADEGCGNEQRCAICDADGNSGSGDGPGETEPVWATSAATSELSVWSESSESDPLICIWVRSTESEPVLYHLIESVHRCFTCRYPDLTNPDLRTCHFRESSAIAR
jgi:hypothetical protein